MINKKVNIIKRKNLDEEVCHRIIEKIIKAEFQQGQQLQINDLADEFGVSRTPVIQAVKMLGSDDVLTVTRTGKIFIPQFTKEQTNDIYLVRLLMERYAISILCSRTDCNEQVFALKKINAQCRRNLEEEDIISYRHNDLLLHRSMVDLINNQCLSSSYRKVQNQYMVANYLLGDHKMDHQNKSVEEHERLLDALGQGDEAAASAYIEDHIRGAFSRILWEG